MKCALCNGPLSTVIELEPTPPANELLLSLDKQPDQDLFPLNFMQCDDCRHLQLDTEVSKERLFSHYVYVSDTGESNRRHFKAYADEMTNKFAPAFVVDVGSNDGLFLSYFDCKVLGVDPAANIDKMVTTLVDFFNPENAQFIIQANGKADLITCNNMFAHNKDLSEVVQGVKQLLTTNGTFVFEVSYALPLLQQGLFDLIYHEHYHHWHVAPMIPYFKKFGLEVVDAQVVATHGGSLRVFVQHLGQGQPTAALQDVLHQEQLTFQKAVDAFRVRVYTSKVQMALLLENILEDNKTVSILGYPAKACTTSYTFGLTKDVITDVFDDNPLKIGLFTHIGHKIRSTAEIYNKQPDYLLILSWNYAAQLMAKHKEFKGKFIVPFPEPRIL